MKSRPAQGLSYPGVASGEAIYLDSFDELVEKGLATRERTPSKWHLKGGVWGARAGQLLTASGGEATPPLELDPGVRGLHSVYIGVFTSGNSSFDNDWSHWGARGRSGVYVRLSSQRHYTLILAERNEPCMGLFFFTTAELGGQRLFIASFELDVSIDFVKLVPVRAPRLPKAATPVIGILDFADDADFSEPPLFEAGASVRRNTDMGIGTIAWKAAAVQCEYHTRVGEQRAYFYEDEPSRLIPSTTSPDPSRKVRGVGGLLLAYDTMRQAVEEAHLAGASILGWVRIANESTKAGWSQFAPTSPFHRAHPDLVQRDRDGASSPRLSLAYPEVREHKAAIVGEVASYGVDGILIDVLRHPPMLSWEPPVVDSYRSSSGVDPRSMPGDGGEEWLRFRASYFTSFLAELRRLLDALPGPRRELWVRTMDQLWRNLVVGCDVEQWVRGGIVDGIIVAPYLGYQEFYPEDVDLAPWLRLAEGRVKIVGQVWRCSSPLLAEALAARFLGQGAGGVAIYESNLAVTMPSFRTRLHRFSRSALLKRHAGATARSLPLRSDEDRG